MASAKEICNMALVRIGGGLITDTVDPPNLTGDDEPSRLSNLFYEQKRDEVLEMFPWRFAKRRINLDVEDQIKDITGATQANPVVITCASHGFTDYRHVYIYDVEGMTDLNTVTYRIASVATDTFELLGVDGAGFGAYTSGGKVRLRPPFEFEYAFSLPTDFLKDWKLYGSDADYDIEEKYLLISDDEIDLEYIAQITDTTKFSPLFIRILYLTLAYVFAQKLADSKTLTLQVGNELNKAIFNVMAIEARKGKQVDERELNSWQTAGRS